MIGSKQGPRLYGIIAEFETPQQIVEAAHQAYEEGYRRMDAYTPYPIEELTHALGFHHTRLPLLVLIGGIAGAAGGFLLQYWTSVIDYPWNIGGRPYFSWPAFIVPSYETTILFAAFTAVLGMLALNGLPRPYHPIFNAPNFELASRNRFFLCIEARDPKFDVTDTASFLKTLGAREVSHVEY